MRSCSAWSDRARFCSRVRRRRTCIIGNVVVNGGGGGAGMEYTDGSIAKVYFRVIVAEGRETARQGACCSC